MRAFTLPMVHRTERQSAPRNESWIAQWWRGLRRRSQPARSNLITPFWDRDAAFAFALAALRQDELSLAEWELTRGDGDHAVNDARCLNLLGVVHECRGHYRRARRCYIRSSRLDKTFPAPRSNLRRCYELTALGNTRINIALGDEMDPFS